MGLFDRLTGGSGDTPDDGSEEPSDEFYEAMDNHRYEEAREMRGPQEFTEATAQYVQDRADQASQYADEADAFDRHSESLEKLASTALEGNLDEQAESMAEESESAASRADLVRMEAYKRAFHAVSAANTAEYVQKRPNVDVDRDTRKELGTAQMKAQQTINVLERDHSDLPFGEYIDQSLEN